MLKRYHLDPNEMSFEVANITNISIHMEEIISNKEDNVDQRNPYNRIEKNKSPEVNASDKKGN